jgi:hypothetical protein
MSCVIACKLPHGLRIEFGGDAVELNGANVHTDAQNPLPNGTEPGGESYSYGFGLTTLSDKQQATFEAWQKAVTHDSNGGPLRDPFPPLANGSIQMFKTETEARRETKDLAGMVTTGLEGLDADAELNKALKDRPGLELETGKR